MPAIGNADTNQRNKFLSADSAFTNNLSFLQDFLPTDTLKKHLKPAERTLARTSRKPDNRFEEFASSEGLRMLLFVHDVRVTTNN